VIAYQSKTEFEQIFGNIPGKEDKFLKIPKVPKPTIKDLKRCTNKNLFLDEEEANEYQNDVQSFLKGLGE
jgi:hypothetical protein